MPAPLQINMVFLTKISFFKKWFTNIQIPANKECYVLLNYQLAYVIFINETSMVRKIQKEINKLTLRVPQALKYRYFEVPYLIEK